jgi:hypothetical protein
MSFGLSKIQHAMPLSDKLHQRKLLEIQKALKTKNYEKLRHLGRTEGGFLRNSLRKLCWSLLLKLDAASMEKLDFQCNYC